MSKYRPLRETSALHRWIPSGTSPMHPAQTRKSSSSTQRHGTEAQPLCDTCAKLDLPGIFQWGIQGHRCLAPDEAKWAELPYGLDPPSTAVLTQYIKEKRSGDSSTLSTTDLAAIEAMLQPTIDLGYFDDIWQKQDRCTFCRFIVRFAIHSYPEYFQEDGWGIYDEKALELEGLAFERLRCVLATFPADELFDFKEQYSGPSALYVDVQLRANGKRFPRLRHLMQDARNAKRFPYPILTSHGPWNISGQPFYSARPIPQRQVDFGLLRGWLHFCRQEHLFPKCRHKASSMPPALRLVDVHKREIIKPLAGCDYYTLSYTMGRPRKTGDFMRLGKADFAVDDMERVGNVPLSTKLSATIEDAIQLVKELGGQYLWIDTLCIVQDDAQDKHSQIANMDEIYANSTLTIIAAAGEDVDAGLPGVRSESRDPTVQIFEDIDGQGVFVSLPSLRQELEQGSRWFSRGWTMQEALLSQRCLIFTPSQVYYKCSAELLSESVQEAEDHQRRFAKPAAWSLDISTPLFVSGGDGFKEAGEEDAIALDKMVMITNSPENLVALTPGMSQLIAVTVEHSDRQVAAEVLPRGLAATPAVAKTPTSSMNADGKPELDNSRKMQLTHVLDMARCVSGMESFFAAFGEGGPQAGLVSKKVLKRMAINFRRLVGPHYRYARTAPFGDLLENKETADEAPDRSVIAASSPNTPSETSLPEEAKPATKDADLRGSKSDSQSVSEAGSEEVQAKRGEDQVEETEHHLDLNVFNKMITDYTCRNLSFDSDALHAFTGILKQFTRTAQTKFIWGLPEADFDFGLTWRTLGKMVGKTRRAEFPSWSWASWPGPITFDRGIGADMVHTSKTAVPGHHYFIQDHKGAMATITQRNSGTVRHDWQSWSTAGNAFGLSHVGQAEGRPGRLIAGGLNPRLDAHSHLLYFETYAASITTYPSTLPQRLRIVPTPEFSSSEGPNASSLLQDDVQPNVGTHIWIDDPDDFWERCAAEKQEFIGLSAWEDEGQAIERSSPEYTEPVVNVLMIEWRDGIAYRLGAGSIKYSLWAEANPIKKMIVLG